MAAIPTRKSLTKQDETLESRFERLAATWHKAVAHQSSSRVRENHPAYREIVALGPEVVPVLLRDLETNRRHWFTALGEITGANPVPAEEAGDVAKMQVAWLRWGREHGYQWSYWFVESDRSTAVPRQHERSRPRVKT